MQNVIPYHSDRFTQIMLNAGSAESIIPSHDLSFATSFMSGVFFLMVKATRPMTFQYLTTEMVKNIDKNGMNDQTVFKTSEKYGFDTIIFSQQVLDIVTGYTSCIRPRLNPVCKYVLVTRNGSQLSRLGDVFGRLVFQAIGKYVHPTRYRQIIETKSAEKLGVDDQNALSLDQKHTSFVAKVHYQKLKSRDVALKGKSLMSQLVNDHSSNSKALNSILEGSKLIYSKNGTREDFTIEKVPPNKILQKRPALNPPEELLSTHSETDVSRSNRKKKVSFSKLEDKFLRLGVQKYGCSWSKILSDPEFSFHSSRKTATLCRRAQTIHIQ